MKVKRLLYLFFLITYPFIVWGQNYNSRDLNQQQIDPSMRTANPDSLNQLIEVISLPPTVYQWKVSEELGNIIRVPADTIFHKFHTTNLTEGMDGHYNHIGNLGAPRLSRIFFDREDPTQTYFITPFSYFVTPPQEQYFTNSNIPFSNITYYKTFNRLYGEERFKAYFSVNVDKKMSFGFNFDYLYGRGYYQQQSTSFFKGGLFGSYIDDKYQAHAIFNSFNLKMAENGGITDDRYITNPEAMAQNGREYESYNIPIRFGNTRAWNYNSDYYVFLTHRYNLGFNREIIEQTIEENDTITTTIQEFVPVTSFIHTAKVERAKHKYLTNNETATDYDFIYLDPSSSRDTTTYLGIKNTFGIALNEGFNKYAKAGLTALISHKYNRYTLMGLDPLRHDVYSEQEVYVGGELSKQDGHFLHYKAIGEVGLADKAIGQFRINGNVDFNFRLGRDTVNFIARGSITNTLPVFYMRHYHSNHLWWDHDNMDKEFRTRIEGELNIDRWGTNIRAGVENLKNYTFLNEMAMPSQESDNIQVLTARFKQDFRVGIFHWDNEVIWQKSSNDRVLPLPELSLYSNFYISAKLAKKVVSLELGADVRYFTKYYAPAYSPLIQQYHIQSYNTDDRILIGNYPIVNIYANIHLKRTRFFVMMYHANQGMGDRNYFLAPHYPINQSLLKFGLSWNFYD